MPIKPIEYTDFLKEGFDKVNGNFTFLSSFGLGLPQGVLQYLSWSLAPGELVDSAGHKYETYSRNGIAYAYAFNGELITAVANTVRVVPGVFGTKSALKLEGPSTNIFPQSVVVDSNSDGLGNGWTIVGNLSDMVLSTPASKLGGLDQKILSTNTATAVGIETFTTASAAHLDKEYVLQVVMRLTRGNPTAFKAIVKGYNAAATHIYTAEAAFTKFKDAAPYGGYAIYTARVKTPSVLDFGNLPGQTAETMATVAVGIHIASTTEYTTHIWHIQGEELAASSPIRTNGATASRAAELLSWPWPTDATQSGTISFWVESPKPAANSTFTLFGKAGELRLEVIDDVVVFTHVTDAGEVSISKLPATPFFDGKKHHVSIGWDNYVDEFGIHRMPYFLEIDGVDQMSPLDPIAIVDPKTQRLCADAYAQLGADDWVLPTKLHFGTNETFTEIENPFVLTATLNPQQLELLHRSNEPLNHTSAVLREKLVYTWSKETTGLSGAQLEINGPERSKFNGTIKSAKLIVGTNSGTNGEFTEADIKINGVSIFTTKPSIEGDAGNYQISSNEVLAVEEVNADDVITADLTDLSLGVKSVTIELVVESLQ